MEKKKKKREKERKIKNKNKKNTYIFGKKNNYIYFFILFFMSATIDMHTTINPNNTKLLMVKTSMKLSVEFLSTTFFPSFAAILFS